MIPYYSGGSVTLHHGSCLDVLAELPDCSVDAVVTDPPYGLANTTPDKIAETVTRWVNGERDYLPGGKGFMGNPWDAFVPPAAVWDDCLRVLKPGGHVLAFAGSRTMDLMGLSLRMAGFDIRDSIAWLYGSGFPKSLDVSKAIDKAAGAEREVIGNTAEASGRTIGLGMSAAGGYEGGPITSGHCRDITAPATDDARTWEGWGTALKPAFEPVVVARKPLVGTVAANVLAHGTGALNIAGCRIATDERVQASASGGVPFGDGNYVDGEGRRYSEAAGRWPANVILDESQAQVLGEPSRFMYVAKAPKSERPNVDGVAHPTVKPLALMRWLVRLVTPPGGTVLEPFAGSGTTIEAALLEGFNVIGVEREAEYLPLIEARIARALATDTDLFGGAA